MNFRVEYRGLQGCILYEEWTAHRDALPSREEALREARAFAAGHDYAVRVVGEDGSVTRVARQRPTTTMSGPPKPRRR